MAEGKTIEVKVETPARSRDARAGRTARRKRGICCAAAESSESETSERGNRAENALSERLLRAFSRLESALFMPDDEPCREGLTPAQCRTLEALCCCPGCTCTTLAEETGVSVSTLTRHVDPLVKAGLVERKPGGDRRVICLCCTKEGVESAEKLKERNRSFVSSILDRIPATSRGHVVKSLELLLDAIENAAQAD